MGMRTPSFFLIYGEPPLLVPPPPQGEGDRGRGDQARERPRQEGPAAATTPRRGTGSPRCGGAPPTRPPTTEQSAPIEGEGRRRDPRGMGGAHRQTQGAQAAADNHARDRNQAARAAQQTAPDPTRGRDLRTRGGGARYPRSGRRAPGPHTDEVLTRLRGKTTAQGGTPTATPASGRDAGTLAASIAAHRTAPPALPPPSRPPSRPAAGSRSGCTG